MGLRSKFNLALFVAFAIALAGGGVVLQRLFAENAREQVLQDARIMMSAADAVRRFTSQQIAPLVAAQNATHFVQASVPSYVAQTTFKALQAQYPDYTYREPALNPTNPNDRPADWERDYINSFRDKPELAELAGERDTPTGISLSLARPIKIANPDCLACHSTPARAPAALLATYGSANGFNWQLNEIIGAQVVSVPMSLAMAQAQRSFLIFMGVLLGIFALIAVVLNVLLHFMVIRPVVTVSCIANAVSLGETDIEEYQRKGNDEISVLAASFNRMRRSLDSAMSMLEH
jgi:HAMP domain-containing protein